MNYSTKMRALLDRERDGRSIGALEKLFNMSASAQRSARFTDIPSGELLFNVTIGESAFLDEDIIFKAHAPIKIGDNVHISKYVSIHTEGHPIHPTQRHLIKAAPIVIGDNVTIGEGAIICNPGKGQILHIGDNATILPGSIVVSNIDKESVVGGKPARRITQEAYEVPSSSHVMGRKISSLSPAIDIKSAFFNTGQTRDITFGERIYGSGFLNIFNQGFLYFNEACGISITDSGKLIAADGTLHGTRCLVVVDNDATLSYEGRTWAGAGSTIHSKAGTEVTIGYGSVIASGSTVSESIPPMSIYAGNRIIRTISDRDLDPSIPAEWHSLEHILNFNPK